MVRILPAVQPLPVINMQEPLIFCRYVRVAASRVWINLGKPFAAILMCPLRMWRAFMIDKYLPLKKMRRSISLFFVSLIAIFISGAINESQASVPDAVLKQENAVVTVYVNDREKGVNITGSGFIVDSNGIVVTNYELISSQISNNGGTILVKTYTKGYYQLQRILAFDENSDLAILKIDASELPVASLAVEYQPVHGEQVVVIGRPSGSETTIMEGSINNILGRKKMIEIGADILPGNVGAPVFNTRGEVIGVATILLIGGESLNFAVPGSAVKDLLRRASIKSGSAGSGEDDRSGGTAKSGSIRPRVNTDGRIKSIPSDWLFFSMSAEQDAVMYYSPQSLRKSGNGIELYIKWIYLSLQGPSYANSQKILKHALGLNNFDLSYGIGLFRFDCENRAGTETKEIYFDSRGDVILVYVPSPLVSSYFAPETVYGYLLDIICKKK
jgi:S1-C subfamily serine protease